MSQRTLRNATYSVHKLIKESHTLSFATRSDYKYILTRLLKDLYALGIQLPHIKNIKQKHIIRVLDQWKDKKLSSGTIKNRLAAIRFALSAMGKSAMLPDNNQALSVKKRRIRPETNRAITSLSLDGVTDPYVALSLRLQYQFGLRRQESIKFIVSQADQGLYINIKGSWTKGGIRRQVPVTTPEQRQLLNDIKNTCKGGKALIPKEKTYRQQLNSYVAQTRKINLKNPHGFRHGYAQRRYRALTDKLSAGKGWDAPINGGIKKRDMTPEQKSIDRDVRELIANELGHRRVEIAAQYLG